MQAGYSIMQAGSRQAGSTLQAVDTLLVVLEDPQRPDCKLCFITYSHNT